MRGSRYWARATLRRRWVGIVALGLLAGLGLGFASVALTGARRADTAYTRLRDQSLAPDAFIGEADVPDDVAAEVAADPSVAALARFAFTPVTPAPLQPGTDGGAFVGLDPAFLDTVYRPVVIEGRLARPGATDEVVANEAMAEAADLQVGETVTLLGGFDEVQELGGATVVGITRGIFDVGATTGSPSLLLGSAFLEAYPDAVVPAGPPILVARLVRGGEGVPTFEAAASRAAGTPVTAGSGDDEAVPVERTLTTQTIALGAMGLIAAMATLAASMQALSRLLDDPLGELPVLIELGVAPRRAPRLAALLALPVIALAPLVAVGATLAGTPRVPTGFARTVDPSVGTHLDLVVVGGLVAAWALTMVTAALVSGRRAGRAGPAEVEPVRAVTRSLPLLARIGSGSALAPVRSRSGAAARSALVAGVVTMAGVVAVATFTASLEHLRDDRRLAGWDFDAALSGFDQSLADFRDSIGAVEAEDGVAAVSWVATVSVEVAVGERTVPVEAYAFAPDAGAVYPTLNEGRPPLADDEVAVGREVLERTGLAVGDPLTVAGPRGRTELEIVGVGPFPEVGQSADLSTFLSVTRSTAQQLGAPETSPLALVRLDPGADGSVLDAYGDRAEVIRSFESGRVRNLGEIGRVPTFLFGFLALLGLAAVTHSLVRSLRARRQDLAVLRAVGFRRRDLFAVSAWQAVTTAVVAAVVGIPLGLVAGRLAWSATATATGVVEVVVVPVVLVAAAAVTALLAWTAAARLIARLVVRGPAAAGLRAD